MDSRRCTHHEGAPAIAICTECESDICVRCHDADARGYAICAVCRSEDLAPQTPWADADTEYAPGTLLRTVWDALRHPIRFFTRVRPTTDGWIAASVFGMLCMGIGLAFSHVWQVLFLAEATQFAEFADQVGVSADTLQTLMFVSIPFSVVLGFVIQTGLFHAAIKIAGGNLHIKSTAKIVGYSAAGYLLMIVPPIGEFALGHFLAIIWLFNLRVNALQQWEDMGPWRSMFVVAIPLMLSLTFMAI